MTYNIIKVLLLNYYAEVPHGIFILLRCIKSNGIFCTKNPADVQNGELPGAIKEGRKWLIPDETIHMNHFAKNKSLPIGVSDFKLATTGYYYVDKTLMIRDFLDKKPMVSLFTRPRRFGKTLNMDMLRVFLKKQTRIHLFISKTNRYGNAAITTLNIKDSILSFF